MLPSRLLSLLLVLGLLVLGLPACVSDAVDDVGEADDDDDDDDDDDVSDDDDSSPPTYSISAQVTDVDGTPLESVAVTACSSGTCLLGSSDANGDVTISGLPGDDSYVIHNISYPGGEDDAALNFSSFYDIIAIAAEDVVLDLPLVIPSITDSEVPANEAAGSVSIGDATVSWTDPIDWPSSVSAVSSPSIGIAEIPEANLPTALGEQATWGAWTFAPFETTIEGEDHPHFTITVPLEGAAVTDTVNFLVAHYEVDIKTEVMESMPASLEEIEGVVYATVEVPVLSMLIAVQ
jgi:hypothetical protein